MLTIPAEKKNTHYGCNILTYHIPIWLDLFLKHPLKDMKLYILYELTNRNFQKSNAVKIAIAFIYLYNKTIFNHKTNFFSCNLIHEVKPKQQAKNLKSMCIISHWRSVVRLT